ncbi:TOMM precursor leader peptide-binding protein [Streptomyces sp. HMX87]|uniref:TOMM precursor leader peptide-binding protein n=1 Tax=Streptomyces sp. HMX87 TaxID=3390849 RepID=UPI003A8B0386
MHVVTAFTDSALDAAQQALAEALRVLLPDGGTGPTVEVGILGVLPPPVPATRGREPGIAQDPAPHHRPTGDGARVLPVRLYRDTALVGPLHTDADAPGPCVMCLERRWTRLRPLKEREALESGTGQYSAGRTHPAPVAWGAPTIAAALLTLAHGPATEPDEVSRHGAPVLEIPLLGGPITQHRLLADPSCPRCGASLPDLPLSLRGFPASRPRARGTGTRLRNWDAYDIPKEALLGPVCGALGARSITDPESPVTTSVGGTLRLGGARTGRSGLYEIPWAGHTDTHAHSETVALFEALERYAGQRPWGRQPAARASLRELTAASLPALDPRPLLYSEDFHARRPGLFRPFRSEQRVDWVWGHSLVRDAPVLVPQQLVYYGPRKSGQSLLAGNSSGCATGSCMEEAALFGLLELIERDAFLLAWYGAERLPDIALDACLDTPSLSAVRDRVEGLGYRLRLFDLRIDLPLPTVLCLARRVEPGPAHLSLSAGAGLTAEEAVTSAVQEVASLLPRLIATAVNTGTEVLRALAADYDTVCDLDDHELLYTLPEMERHVPFVRPGDAPVSLRQTFADWSRRGLPSGDLLDDLRECVRLVAEVSDEVIVVDQTSPEQRACGLHTAAVVAPGLVPIDFGWRQQRALEHPRLRWASWRAGRRPGPLRDEDVHRHPHPFP